ncbi:MAG TPA: complex I subunit 1 family protein, partial [Polyangia bacterium]|nr:complex I subunit 1 family protein [Polyangia bacterium]
MGLVLLFVLPVIAFSAISLALVAVLGVALPWIASHPWGTWAMDPWFQALAKMLLLVLLVVMPMASLLTWVERKQSAVMQDRIGPNRASIGGLRAWGIIHFLADAIKMIMKEDFVPAKANKFLFSLAPVMAIVPVFVTFAIVPFGGDICTGQLTQVVADPSLCASHVSMQVARLDVGLLFYFAIASLAVYGTTLAGWASYNKWSLLGGLRASSQMMSYEVTMGMSILGAFLVYGTLEPGAIVRAQGANPLHWGVITQPLGCLLFFTAAIAETKRTPFDTPEGESEVIGYFVEYSGMRFGMFFLA